MKASRLLKTIGAFALSVLLSSNVVAQDTRANTATIEKMRADRYDAIMSRLNQRGAVRVIVELATQAEPDLTTPLPSLAADSRLAGRRAAAVARLQDRALARLTRVQAALLKRFKHMPYMALEADAAMLAQLARLSDVVSIREDERVRPVLAQSVPRIGADTTANNGFGGAGQAVAILDTGVDKFHGFLSGKIVAEACFSTTSNSNNSTSLCPNGSNRQIGSGAGVHCSGIGGCDHGTHVAGIAAGSGNGLSGVAQDADLIAIQVFSRFDDASFCGSSSPCIAAFTSDYIEALEYLYDNRNSFNIASANMSLGGGNYTSASSCDSNNSATKAAIDNLRAAGIATVIASGNNGVKNAISSPGCISSAIGVGASTDSDAVASFSNSASWLPVLAPGTSIQSSVPGGGFANKNGTSMATPHVAGAVAVLKSKKPTASVNEILAALTSTGVPVRDAGNGLTIPRIQVDAAVESFSSTPTPPSTDIIIDNRAANTSRTGTWKVSSAANPWAGESLYSNSGGTFRWRPNLSQSGNYEVYAWWTYHANRSATVPYRVKHTSGIDTTIVNQRSSSLGGKWVLLGTYTLNGDGYVEVSSENGQAAADAVKLVKVDVVPPPAPTAPSEIIVDNKASSTSRTGTWSVSGGPNPWAGQSLYSNSGGTFRWQPAVASAGSYDVYAWWTYHANRATSVPYRVKHANGTATIRVNQRDSSQGGKWVLLGRYELAADDSAYVEVSSESGQASADAIRLVP